ncbi:ATP-binding protein, partial [Streptococcus pneumoniae]
SKQESYRFYLQEDCDLSLILLIHLDYLKRALLNILLNALEHADQDQKEVKLMVSVQQDQLVFAIWNNGPSFSEEMLLGAERLFY